MTTQAYLYRQDDALKVPVGLVSDIETLRRLDGILVGLLDEEELAALDRLTTAGLARRDYSGPAGFLGLARVRLAPASAEGDVR